VIGHHGMHDILGSPPGHVTCDARGRPGGHFRGVRRCVTIPAYYCVTRSGYFRELNGVSIVAGGAGYLAGAKACRFAQPIGRIHDLEFVVVTDAWRVIEEHGGIAQWLTWPVGERLLRMTKNLVRQRKLGGLQVTLHAHFQLAVAVQFGGIDDGRTDGLRRGATGSGGFDVGATRSMAALAIDSFRDAVAEKGLAGGQVRTLARRRVGGVAGQASGGNGAPEVILVGAIVAWAHGPKSALLCVPTHRQLHQSALRCAIQIAPGVVAGSHNIVDFFLDNVSWLPVETDLMTALVPRAVYVRS
jgi:hypothetical protein